MKKIKRTLIFLLIVVIALAGIYIANKGGILKVTTEKSSVADLLQDNLAELSDFTSLKYEYTNVIVSKTDRKLPLGFTDIHFAEAIKLIRYSGYIKAGIDLSKVQVSPEDGQLLIKIPRSKILDNVAETETATVEDIKGNIFSDYPSQYLFDEINAEKDKLEKDKIDQGLLDQADQVAVKFLTAFLKSHGYNEFVIDFLTP